MTLTVMKNQSFDSLSIFAYCDTGSWGFASIRPDQKKSCLATPRSLEKSLGEGSTLRNAMLTVLKGPFKPMILKIKETKYIIPHLPHAATISLTLN